jgi:16S rRNA (guanine527-N7)-methyltransferase
MSAPSALSEERIAYLLRPYVGDEEVPSRLYGQLKTYLELLLRWNAVTNLTAIREPEEIVQRHFGESLFTGLALRSRLPASATLLDFGSGAGFPGLPIHLLLPELAVTLAESQGKKAAFLREAVRLLELPAEVWSARVELMPATRTFDCVTLRAVDNMEAALVEAWRRVSTGGWMAILAGDSGVTATAGEIAIPLPDSATRKLLLLQR